MQLILEQLENRLLLSGSYNPEPADLKSGLDYEYYEGNWIVLPDFDLLTAVHTGTDNNFDIDTRDQNDRFGYRFTGYVDITTAGNYTFYTKSDDGSQLFIDGNLVVDNDGLHGEVEEQGAVNLAIGKHAIKVTYFDHLGGEKLQVKYEGPGFGKTDIPDGVLYRDAPAPPAPDLEAGSDSGSSSTDNITNDTTATFSAGAGTVPNNSTVWLRVNGVNKQSTTDTADGSYSITLSDGDMIEGVNAIDVFYMDSTGDISGDSDNLSVTLDTTINQPSAPDLQADSDSGSSNTDNITNSANLVFEGYVDAGLSVQMYVDGVAQGSATTADGFGYWTVTLPNTDLAEGANSITVKTTDTAGNVSVASAALTVTLDTTAAAPASAPDLANGSDTGLANDDDYTNDTTAMFTGPAGAVPADATVWLRVGGTNKQSTTAAGDGSFSVTLVAGDMSEGNNTIDYIYIDSAGNTSGDSPDLTVTLDTSSDAPSTPDLTSDATNDTGMSQVDDITANDACTVTGTAEANATVHVFVNGTEVGSTTADGGGDWSYTFDGVDDLIEGANTVTVTAVDSLSNSASVQSGGLVITLDTGIATPAAPDLQAADDTGDLDTDNITGAANLAFTGYAEPSATVQMLVGGNSKGASTTANATTGAWTVTLAATDFAAGTNNVTISVTDAAGNIATSPALVVTYDTTGTVPGAPKLRNSSDSGTADDDGITNLAAVTVYGTVADGNAVEGGATVHVRTNKNGGGWTEIGTTVADATGNWSYTLDGVDDLAEGSNLVDVYITDVAGNDSGDSGDLTLVLDTTASAPASAPDLAAGSDSGTSSSDNITNDTTPTFSGTAGSVEADATVWLRVDGSAVRSTTAAGDGSWAITLQAGDLAEGTNVIDVIYVDTAGNTSGDSANLSVTLDTTATAPTAAPELDSGSDTGSDNTDNVTNDTTATFTGEADSVEGGSTVWLRVGGVDTRSVTANADGSWSITLQDGDLSAGANVVDYYYIDPAGNTSTDSANLSVTLDTAIADPAQPDMTAASDTGTANDDDVTAETRPTIEGGAGSVEGSSTVHIWLDTPSAADTEVGTTTAAVDGSWSYTFTAATPLEEGVNVIHIVAVDEAGNTSNDSPDLDITVNFDAGAEAAPDLNASSDSGSDNTDNITNETTPTISGTCPSGATIKIRTNGGNIAQFTDNDGTDGDAAAGQWTYTFPGGVLSTGVNTIDFMTIDTSNHASDWSLNLVVMLDTSIEQPSKPDLATASDSGSNNGDDLTNDTTPTLSGTAEADSSVTIDINAGAHTTTVTTGADGIWTYDVPDGWLSEGANTIYVQATDTAGNVSANSSSLTVTLDTTIGTPSAPDLTAATDTGSSTTDNITSHSNPRITGTADAGATITVRLDPNGAATAVGTTTADAGGDWSYTFDAGVLSEGANEIDVVATDDAGNSAESADLTITIETVISVPANLDLATASDLGDADDDNITSLATATITGTADPGCTVYVRVNGTIVGNTTADGVGDWAYTFDGVDDLSENSNVIDVYAEDSTGNVSDFTADLIVTLDTQITTPAAPDLQAASDSGTSDTDDYTNDAAAVINGTCEAGATIIIHLNGNDNFATVTDADADGLWSYTFAGGLNADADGAANTIKVAQRDVAGNLSAYSTVLTLTLDDTATTPGQPDLEAMSDSGDADDDDITNIANVSITGTVEPDSSLQLYVDKGAGPVLIDTISERLLSSGSYSYTFSNGQLAAGDNLVTVVATDKAGNVSASSPALTITLDQSIAQPGTPDLSASSDTGDITDDDITSDLTPTFTGVADANSHVTIRVNGEPVNTVDADATGNWSYTFAEGEIQSGVRQIDVVAVDAAGNESQPSDDLTIWLNVEPTQPAAPNLQSASDSGSIDTDNLTKIDTGIIDGKADADRTVEVYVDDQLVGSTTSDSNGFWQYQFAQGVLSEGDNVITIITEDSSGLRSTASLPLTITLDVTAPAAPQPDLQDASDTGMSNTDNRTSDTTATIQGTTEANALVDVYLDGNLHAELTASAQGAWTYTFAPDVLQEGENDIYVLITDVAGNTSAPSDILSVVLDIQQDTPEVPVLDPASASSNASGDNVINNATPTISGAVKPDSQVDILVDGDTVATIQTDYHGTWEHTFSTGDLQEGTNYIEVLSTDAVGNTARSAALELTLDTTPPIIYNYFPNGSYPNTTQTIELYVHADDMNVLTAVNTQGYILIGSGGDGTYDDGNEWQVPVEQVSVDNLAGLVQLTTATILTDDYYRLELDPETTLVDDAGNPAQLDLSASHAAGATADSDEIVLPFQIDTAGPPAPQTPQLDAGYDTGVSDADNITTNSNPLVWVTADADLTVEIIVNGISAGVANEVSTGLYQRYIDNSMLREGENLLMARAFDGLGNSSDLSDMETLIYDSTGPKVAAIIVDDAYYDVGPTTINVIFNEPGLDEQAVLDLNNYIILAAGGDGGFSDGNEHIITPSAVTYNDETGTLVLTMPTTVTGQSQLGPDQYRLSILSSGTITDVAGNKLQQDAVQQFTVYQTYLVQQGTPYKFVTDNGTRVKLKLRGSGQARFCRGEDVGSIHTIEQIILRDTDDSTVLRIKAADTAEQVTVGSILADSAMGVINLANTDVAEQITLEQGVRKMLLAAVEDNALITVGATAVDMAGGIYVTADYLGTDVDIDIAGHVSLLKTRSSLTGTLQADAIDKLEVTRGDMAATVSVTEGSVDAIRINNGNLTGDITVAGDVGIIKVPRGQVSGTIQADNITGIQARNFNGSVIRAAGVLDMVIAHWADDSSISAGGTLGRIQFRDDVRSSTLAAGGDFTWLGIGGDAVDDLFLSGVDVGTDGWLDGNDDTFSDSRLECIRIRGTYDSTITAASVDPGADLAYFTTDDILDYNGNIAKVVLHDVTLNAENIDNVFGLLAGGSITPFNFNGNKVDGPFNQDGFHVLSGANDTQPLHTHYD